jgi:hypothetical protein
MSRRPLREKQRLFWRLTLEGRIRRRRGRVLIAELLADSRYITGVAYGFRANSPIIPLDI